VEGKLAQEARQHTDLVSRVGGLSKAFQESQGGWHAEGILEGVQNVGLHLQDGLTRAHAARHDNEVCHREGGSFLLGQRERRRVRPRIIGNSAKDDADLELARQENGRDTEQQELVEGHDAFSQETINHIDRQEQRIGAQLEAVVQIQDPIDKCSAAPLGEFGLLRHVVYRNRVPNL